MKGQAMTDPSVNEKPIIFGGPMIRALLARRKTMTRRLVNDLPPTPIHAVFCDEEGSWFASDRGDGTHESDPDACLIRRPPYPVGTRLWCRESYRASAVFDSRPPSKIPEGSPIHYEADGANPGGTWGKLRPGMFMVRWMSRLFRVVTAVKCERVNAISEEDAVAEGVVGRFGGLDDEAVGAAEVFAELWDSLHGPGSFASGPWVFAYTLGEE